MFRPAFLSVTNQVRKIDSAWEKSFRFYNGSLFPLEKDSSCLDDSIMRTDHHFISNFVINYLLFRCQKWIHFDACNGAFTLSSTYNIYQYFTEIFNSLHWIIYWRSLVWIATEDIMHWYDILNLSNSLKNGNKKRNCISLLHDLFWFV